VWFALTYVINPLKMNALELEDESSFGGSVSAYICTFGRRWLESQV